jgi:hypothetical protein
MGSYVIWECRNCRTTVLCKGDKRGNWDSPPRANADMDCCPKADIHWAASDIPSAVELPDDEDIPEPEFPRRSRIELALEDAFHG